ncbi:MAG: serine hydrolase domain-containing protein [Pseudomonadota bacterium]
MRWIIVSSLAGWLAGCGGGGGAGQPAGPVASVTPPPTTASDPWARVTEALITHPVDDLALIVGDANGVLFQYEKGAFRVTDEHRVASASKWLTSATVLTLVEQGVMSLDDRPQDYLAAWPADPSDPRSRITLTHLLSFTSGFHRSPADGGCIGDEQFNVQSCVQQLQAMELDAEPGTTFFYGPVHMQIAAAMAEVATGQAWRELVTLALTQPLGMTSTRFEGTNPRASGGAISSAQDFATFLQSHLSGALLSSSFAELAEPRLTDVDIVSRPAAVEANGVDWYYALGVWRECEAALWSAECAARTRVSSPGAFGWYPWLDTDNGYFAVLAMEESVRLFTRPAESSVLLGKSLQALIVDAIATPQ